MPLQRIHDLLHAMVRDDVAAACAVIDGESGLSVCSAGKHVDFDVIASVSVETWRVQQRNIGHLEVLGDLRVTAALFDRGMMIVTPCQLDPVMLLVGCLDSARLQPAVWRERAVQVREILRSANAPRH
jgi:hypothetical protein